MRTGHPRAIVKPGSQAEHNWTGMKKIKMIMSKREQETRRVKETSETGRLRPMDLGTISHSRRNESHAE